jgi:hypothetical protein
MDNAVDGMICYRDEIKRVLQEHAAHKPAYGDIEVELILDDARDHYELSYIGWDGYRRVHGSVIHVDIRDDKIWVQHDGTEEGFANRLLEAGIPADRIVLAYQHPVRRKLTPFAVA